MQGSQSRGLSHAAGNVLQPSNTWCESIPTSAETRGAIVAEAAVEPHVQGCHRVSAISGACAVSWLSPKFIWSGGAGGHSKGPMILEFTQTPRRAPVAGM